MVNLTKILFILSLIILGAYALLSSIALVGNLDCYIYEPTLEQMDQCLVTNLNTKEIIARVSHEEVIKGSFLLNQSLLGSDDEIEITCEGLPGEGIRRRSTLEFYFGKGCDNYGD